MNWADEPATWKQLRYLKSSGCPPDHRLTKMEASEIIARLGGPSELQFTVRETEEHLPAKADDFHQEVANAQRALTQATATDYEHLRRKLELALADRREFWLETCRGTTRMEIGSQQALELYRKHGCLYTGPTQRQLQAILDALDAAMPFWDRDHPEIFYQALGMNFPELVKQSVVNRPMA